MESQYDYIITVAVDENERINRVVKRDRLSKEKVKAIIRNQISDGYKIGKSDFVIINNDLKSTKKQVDKIHSQILENLPKL